MSAITTTIDQDRVRKGHIKRLGLLAQQIEENAGDVALWYEELAKAKQARTVLVHAHRNLMRELGLVSDGVEASVVDRHAELCAAAERKRTELEAITRQLEDLEADLCTSSK